MKVISAFCLLFFFSVWLAVPLAFAEEGQVSIADFPQQLANAFDTSLFVGQLIATAMLLCFLEFPTLLLSKGQPALALIVGLLALFICVGIGWLPIWTILVTCLFVGLLFGDKMRVWLTGRGT